VLAGAWRDPLAGGDVLIGITGGAVSGVLACLDAVLRMGAAAVPAELNGRLPAPLMGAHMAAASWLLAVANAVLNALWLFLLIFLLRAVVRKSWAAAVVCIGFLAGVQMLRGGSVVAWDVPIWTAIFTIGIITLMRFGMLAFAAG